MNDGNQKYNTRYDHVVTEISKDEAIKLIENKYHALYDPESNLDVWDQLLICESLEESTPIKESVNTQEKGKNENGNGNGSVNGGCKRRVNFTLNGNKLRAISELNDFTHKATPLEIESWLSEIFLEFPAVDGWWLYVGQHWTQRQINWVLKEVLKLQVSGRITRNPAACFTFLIRKRKRRNTDIE